MARPTHTPPQRETSYMHVIDKEKEELKPFQSSTVNWGELAREIAKVKAVPNYETGFNPNTPYESTYNQTYYFAGNEDSVWEKDENITYVMNNYGHRSDDFTDKHDGLHVLFAGCSETFGFGANIEDNWSKIAYNELCKTEKLSGFYRLAISGASWHVIVNNISGYIEKFGKPDRIYINMPNIERMVEYDFRANSYWDNCYPDTMMYLSQKEMQDRDWSGFVNGPLLTEQQFLNNLANFAIFMRMFETMCDQLGIDLTWTCWSHYSDEFIKNIPHIKHYQSMFNLDALEYTKSQFYSRQENNRSQHVNLHVQQHWANTVLGKTKDPSGLSQEEIDFLKKDLSGRGDYIY